MATRIDSILLNSLVAEGNTPGIIENLQHDHDYTWNGEDKDYLKLDNILENYRMDRLKKMLKGGAPLLYKNDENYAMKHAALHTRKDIMELILNRYDDEKKPGMEEEFKSQANESLLKVCATNSGEIARMLLDAGAEIDPEKHLHKAAENGSKAVLEELIKTMKNIEDIINALDAEGYTPLQYAIKNKHTHTVQYLLDNKANVNKIADNGWNSIHFACQYADIDILYLLIKRGGDVNAKDLKGKTPTMIAALNGKDDCISLLATAGANLDQKDDDGQVPLIVAATDGHANTVRELITNGASYDVTDNTRYNAIERAIISKKDGAAAILIRLAPQDDYLEYYLYNSEIDLFKIVRYRLKETVKALLDRMLIQDPSNPHFGVVFTKYLDLDTKNIIPDDEDYKKNKTFFLQRISDYGDEDIAYNGTIRLLVDEKMKKIGNIILGIKILFNILFLLALAYSLLQASYENSPRDAYTINAVNIIRILTELYVFIYTVFNIVAEGVELYRVGKLANRYIQDKKDNRGEEEERTHPFARELRDNAASPNHMIEERRKITSRLNDIIWIRMFTDYFSDWTNFLDVLGISTLLILVVLRIARQPSQWIFATLTFFINSLRFFKLIVLIPYMGTYANIFYQILKRDVLQFLALFTLFLLIFTGTYFIALRTPYTAEGFRNVSLMQDTQRELGVDNSLQWVFLSGLRILLEGNVYDTVYVYQQLNWLAAFFYLTFLFLTVVVFLNMFIAQLSDTYAKVKENAERAYAWLRLNFIVQIQRTSLLSLCCDIRKKSFIEKIEIGKDDMHKYYGVYSIKDLNTKHFTDDVEVKRMLASIQSQQIFAQKTHEISKSNPDEVKQVQSQDKGAEEIRKLNAKINELNEKIDNVASELVKEMAELKSSFSMETIIKIIKEKN